MYDGTSKIPNIILVPCGDNNILDKLSWIYVWGGYSPNSFMGRGYFLLVKVKLK